MTDGSWTNRELLSFDLARIHSFGNELELRYIFGARPLDQ